MMISQPKLRLVDILLSVALVMMQSCLKSSSAHVTSSNVQRKIVDVLAECETGLGTHEELTRDELAQFCSTGALINILDQHNANWDATELALAVLDDEGYFIEGFEEILPPFDSLPQKAFNNFEKYLCKYGDSENNEINTFCNLPSRFKDMPESAMVPLGNLNKVKREKVIGKMCDSIFDSWEEIMEKSKKYFQKKGFIFPLAAEDYYEQDIGVDAEPVTDEPSTKSITDEPTPVPRTDEPTLVPKTDEPTAAPTTTQPTAAPRTDEPTPAPTTTEPTLTPATNVPTFFPSTKELTLAPMTNMPTTAPITTEPTVAVTAVRTTDGPSSAIATKTAGSAGIDTAEGLFQDTHEVTKHLGEDEVGMVSPPDKNDVADAEFSMGVLAESENRTASNGDDALSTGLLFGETTQSEDETKTLDDIDAEETHTSVNATSIEPESEIEIQTEFEVDRTPKASASSAILGSSTPKRGLGLMGIIIVAVCALVLFLTLVAGVAFIKPRRTRKSSVEQYTEELEIPVEPEVLPSTWIIHGASYNEPTVEERDMGPCTTFKERFEAVLAKPSDEII